MAPDVAVVEPAARVVLGEAGGRDVAGAERDVVDRRPADGRHPAVSVDVEGVEVVVDRVDVEGDVVADVGLQGRRVAGVGAAVDAVEGLVEPGRRRLEGVEADEELLVGPRLRRVADDDRPEQALVDRQRLARPVVVVPPGALRARDGLPDVGDLVALLDEPARIGVLALVGAVHVDRVLEAVRVHRHRRRELAAEVDGDRLADVRLEQRAGHRGRAERLGEVWPSRRDSPRP